MIAEPRRGKTGSGKTGSWRKKHTNLAKAEANPTTGVDRIIVKRSSGRAHVKKPRVGMPAKCRGRELVAAGEISRESDEWNETRQIKMAGQEFDKKEDRIKPNELGSGIKERAAAVNTSDARATFDEPIQNRV